MSAFLYWGVNLDSGGPDVGDLGPGRVLIRRGHPEGQCNYTCNYTITQSRLDGASPVWVVAVVVALLRAARGKCLLSGSHRARNSALIYMGASGAS